MKLSAAILFQCIQAAHHIDSFSFPSGGCCHECCYHCVFRLGLAFMAISINAVASGLQANKDEPGACVFIWPLQAEVITVMSGNLSMPIRECCSAAIIVWLAWYAKVTCHFAIGDSVVLQLRWDWHMSINVLLRGSFELDFWLLSQTKHVHLRALENASDVQIKKQVWTKVEVPNKYCIARANKFLCPFFLDQNIISVERKIKRTEHFGCQLLGWGLNKREMR